MSDGLAAVRAWIKPAACACLVAFALAPFGVASIPKSEKDVQVAFVPAALFVLPFMLPPLGVVALLVGVSLCVRPSWRHAGVNCVRFGASLLTIALLSGWIFLPFLK